MGAWAAVTATYGQAWCVCDDEFALGWHLLDEWHAGGEALALWRSWGLGYLGGNPLLLLESRRRCFHHSLL